MNYDPGDRVGVERHVRGDSRWLVEKGTVVDSDPHHCLADVRLDSGVVARDVPYHHIFPVPQEGGDR